MKKRLTLRDIATHLGLHYTTVSMALRNHPDIRESTRLKIVAAAREMGYVPDPMVSALAIYRQSLRPAAFHSNLAWLTNSDQPLLGETYAYQAEAEGARRRAAVLGYGLEEFPLHADGISSKRYVRVLGARGIQGILVAPQPTGRINKRIRLDWSGFSAVASGHMLAWPPIHRVASNHFQSAQLAVRELRKLGYQRIGLCVSRVFNSRGLFGWSGGYLTEMQRKGRAIEPLIWDSFIPEVAHKWVRANRLEAVVVSSSGLFLPHWRVPDELALADLDLRSEGHGLAGINQRSQLCGEILVNQLVNLIHTGEKGIPVALHQTLVNGIWVPGPSAPRMTKPR